ncbi:hypothetical protein [Winogradskyella sp.]|uniref:hypothetical protein n=1 Tax=Winogradskyella sp. TaxID=1883156 RepID=UPI00260F5A3C|nr:hypothetical protein [Winogradskyella sp.]
MIKKFLAVIVITSLSISCAKKITVPLTAEVNVVNEDAHKTIELRSVGFGNNIDEATYDSEKKAFEILFFRGIPNTHIENPLIGANENEILSKHPSYFKSFFESRYKSFIMSIYQSSPTQKNNGVTSVVNDIKINTMALKRDLETNNIIRKFGF